MSAAPRAGAPAIIGAEPEIILDISRLLSRVMHPTPTGVDRVEMCYARGLLRMVPKRLRFAAVHPSGLYGRLPLGAVERFLDATERRWESARDLSRRTLRHSALGSLALLRPRMLPPRREGPRPRFVLASPNHLTDPRVMQDILAREQAAFVALVFDLIPIELPEYARPGGAALHARRMDTLLRHADGLLCISHTVQASLERHMAGRPRRPLTGAAHIGTTVMEGLRPAIADRPYFMCLGTIEPRKNHLLLLHLWRQWAEQAGGAAIPRLVIVGRRGWENEQIVDLLERSPALKDCVEEQAGLSDRTVQEMLLGSRGLLMPSFAEGYGLPVSEALALGVPVLCSDIPAHREAGGDVPEFLDPLDGPGWRRAIEDLSHPASAIAAAQARRRRTWRCHGWPEHLAILLEMLHKLPA